MTAPENLYVRGINCLRFINSNFTFGGGMGDKTVMLFDQRPALAMYEAIRANLLSYPLRYSQQGRTLVKLCNLTLGFAS